MNTNQNKENHLSKAKMDNSKTSNLTTQSSFYHTTTSNVLKIEEASSTNRKSNQNNFKSITSQLENVKIKPNKFIDLIHNNPSIPMPTFSANLVRISQQRVCFCFKFYYTQMN